MLCFSLTGTRECDSLFFRHTDTHIHIHTQEFLAHRSQNKRMRGCSLLATYTSLCVSACLFPVQIKIYSSVFSLLCSVSLAHNMHD